MDYFYDNKIRLILLTKYNCKSIYELSTIREINLSLNFDTRKLEALTALSILSNKSKSFYLDIAKSKKNNFIKSASGQIHFVLKKEQILFFVNKLVYIYLPRVRYFKGFTLQNIQNNGNFLYIFNDLLIFPELEEEMEIFYKLAKLKLQVVLEQNISERKSRFLLWLFGIPFVLN